MYEGVLAIHFTTLKTRGSGRSRRPWPRAAASRRRRAPLPQGHVHSHSSSNTTSPVSAVGIPVFGPTADAARMEGSKSFAKDFMTRHGIPTATHKTFQASDYQNALAYVRSCGHRVVLKASGLAAGKGVLVPESLEETEEGLKQIMIDNAFGTAGWSPLPLIIAFDTRDRRECRDRRVSRRSRAVSARVLGRLHRRTSSRCSGSQTHRGRRCRTEHGWHGRICACSSRDPGSNQDYNGKVPYTYHRGNAQRRYRNCHFIAQALNPCRVSVRRPVIHGLHPDERRPENPRVQRALRRSRDRSAPASARRAVRSRRNSPCAHASPFPLCQILTLRRHALSIVWTQSPSKLAVDLRSPWCLPLRAILARIARVFPST